MSRVFHVLTENEPFSEFHGGAISRWAAYILRGDVDSIVVCPKTDGSWGFPSSRVLLAPRLRIYSKLSKILRRDLLLQFGSNLILVNPQLLHWLLRPVLTRLQAGDIVWIHNRPEFAAALIDVVHKRRAKLVLHMHNSHLLDGWHAPPSVLNRLPVDATVFVSSFLRDEAKRIQPKYDDAFVLYNGADQSIFHPDDAPRQTYGPTTVLYVGRLIPEKGPHLFFEAMRQLHQEGLNVRGIIIGASALPGEREGSYAQSLRKNIPPNVVFHPYCVGNKLGDVFRNADIFCHPAQWEEPFGMVIVEAMASGLPVVATRCGGIPEILKNGGGVLVNRDSIEELVSTLKELVRNNSLRKMLGQEARSSFLKSFPWSVAKQSYQAIARGLSDASK